MKKLFAIALLGSLFLLPGVSGQDIKSQVKSMLIPGEYADQEIIVKFKSERTTAGDILDSRNISDSESLGMTGAIRITVAGDMTQTLIKLLSDPRVLYAEPNYIVRLAKKSTDPKLGELWGMAKIQAPQAWNKRTDSSSIIVAVIDTGVDYNHVDIKDNMWVNKAELNGTPGVDDDKNGYIDDIYGWNGAKDNGDPMDRHNHGTHCSGTIAGRGDNNLGVVGVCWSAKIMACRFLNGNGSGKLSNAIKCVNYAVANGAKVMSNSWGGGWFSPALYDAIKSAQKAGVLFVAAAGNNGSPKLINPANYCNENRWQGKTYPGLDNVFAVAASTQDDSKASFSQYSKKTIARGDMIAAPGYHILSTIRNNKYAFYNGTSMATPHVTGAATLLWAEFPQLTYMQIKQILVASGDEVIWEGVLWDKFKIKRLNIYKAFQKAATLTSKKSAQ